LLCFRRHAAQESLRKARKRKLKDANGGAGKKSKSTKPPTLCNLSPALSLVFDGETQLSRGDVVRRLWIYIKANGLQDEKNKRRIVMDDKLRAVFGKERKTVDMFRMNALLSKHLIKDEEIA
jgi:chromatin remodeling complex protein RSC6